MKKKNHTISKFAKVVSLTLLCPPPLPPSISNKQQVICLMVEFKVRGELVSFSLLLQL